MELNELTAVGITDEQAKTVLDLVSKNYIEKSKYDELVAEKDKTKEVLKERDKQLEDLKNNVTDINSLKEQITLLQGENEKKEKEYKKEIEKIKIDGIVNNALTRANARNILAVKPLLSKFLENARLDGDNVVGLNDEINKLVTGDDTSFLFETNKFVGVTPVSGADESQGQKKEVTLESAIFNSISQNFK